MIDKFIFSIDPSINNVGWAHLFCHNNTLTLLEAGIFHNNLESLLDKMNFIFQSIREKIQSIHVDAIVVEETLVNINPFTSLKLSKGQCSAIAGSFGHGFPVYIYSCKSPRKALLNNGNAQKKECREFIEKIVGKVANEHIADAVLLGYYHHYKQMNPFIPVEKTKRKKKIKSVESQSNNPDNIIIQSKKIKSKKKPVESIKLLDINIENSIIEESPVIKVKKNIKKNNKTTNDLIDINNDTPSFANVKKKINKK